MTKTTHKIIVSDYKNRICTGNKFLTGFCRGCSLVTMYTAQEGGGGVVDFGGGRGGSGGSQCLQLVAAARRDALGSIRGCEGNRLMARGRSPFSLMKHL